MAHTCLHTLCSNSTSVNDCHSHPIWLQECMAHLICTLMKANRRRSLMLLAHLGRRLEAGTQAGLLEACAQAGLLHHLLCFPCHVILQTRQTFAVSAMDLSLPWPQRDKRSDRRGGGESLLVQQACHVVHSPRMLQCHSPQLLTGLHRHREMMEMTSPYCRIRSKVPPIIHDIHACRHVALGLALQTSTIILNSPSQSSQQHLWHYLPAPVPVKTHSSLQCGLRVGLG